MRSKVTNGKLALLHIDDSADDRLFLREAIALSKTPFDCHQAESLESAIAYFQFHPDQHPRPSLVLLDYDLGHYTGLDFLYWLRVLQKERSIPVIMFSGSPGRKHVEEAYAAGANYFITKPKKFESLKLIVHTLHVFLVSRKRPGPLVLLKEYRPDPRIHLTTSEQV